MINSITVTNHLGSYATIELRNPEKSGFCILNMDGISTNQANINITDIGTTDGSYFNSARISSRNITMEIKLLEHPTIEECRHTFYTLFQPKFPIRLTFHLDTRDCYVDGYVESASVEIFTKWEVANVSIICPDPYFHDVNSEETVFSSITDNFETPIYGDDVYIMLSDQDYTTITGPHSATWNEVGSGGSGHYFVLTNSPAISTTNTPRCTHLQYSNTDSGKWGTFKVTPGITIFDSEGRHSLDSFKEWLRVNHPVIKEIETSRYDFNGYSALVSALNSAELNDYPEGSSLYVNNVLVPTLYVNDLQANPVTYTYTTDNAFITDLNAGTLQVGHCKLIEDYRENIVFGMITYYTEKNIYYDGEDQIGVEITMHALDSVGDITLYNVNTREEMKISSTIIATMTGTGISAMDDIVINTNPGQKSVTLMRGGTEINILNSLGRNSDWFLLANGDNKFTYTATSGASNLIFSISHRNVYTGI